MREARARPRPPPNLAAISPRSRRCAKEHELELDITLEFAIEAKLSAYIALTAVGGAVAFNYGRVS